MEEIKELRKKMDAYLASTWSMIEAIHKAKLFLNMENKGCFYPLIKEDEQLSTMIYEAQKKLQAYF